MNDIAANGYTTFYYGFAKLYMEEAPSLVMTNKRRKRWMTGVVDSRRLYNDKVNKMASVSNRYYVHCLWIIYFYIGAAVIYSVSAFVMGTVLLILENPAFKMALIVSGASLGIVYLSFFVMTLFAVIIDWKNYKMPAYKKILLLFLHPAFYMDYIRIVGGALLNLNSKRWDAIARVEEGSEVKNA